MYRHRHDLDATLPESESTCSSPILLSASSSVRLATVFPVRQCALPAPAGDEVLLAFDFCGFPRFLERPRAADQLLTVPLQHCSLTPKPTRASFARAAPLPLKVIIVLKNKEAPIHDTTNTCSCDCACAVSPTVSRDMTENNSANLSDCTWPILEPTRMRCAGKTTLTKLRTLCK